MSLLDAALKRLERITDARIAAAEPFRAIVASVDSSGMVTVRRLTATTAESELRARVDGFAVAVNDEVLCLPVSGQPVVIGRVQRAATSVHALDSALGVGNSASATGPVGSITGKIEVFDETGASLGYLPVYDAIT